MSDESLSIEVKVRQIVSDALDVKPADIRLHSSLIDDLGAESIDFLDILFRVETEFDMSIEENELWRGSIDSDDPEAIALGVQKLKARMPEFHWDRLPATLTRADLPRLITVQTIIDYLGQRLQAGGDHPPRASG